MKILGKIAAMTAALIMTAGGLAACNGADKSVGGMQRAIGKNVIAEKPVEITFFYPASKASDGQWEILEEAGRMTNVYAKVTMSKSNTDFEQAFNLMLASGNMPDIVQTYNPTSLSKYGAEGAFVKLNDYIDQYAPNIKAFLEENSEIKRRITAFDGNIYYIPHIPGGDVSTGWFVRQDWLDKLNLSEPKTTEELYRVLKAFKTQDPNGNGNADEVPYFSSASGVNCLFPLWGANPDWFMRDGTVKYGPYEPEYKEAITNIAGWYKEGLIDNEIFTRGNNAREKLFSENAGGITHDWFGSTAAFNNSLADKIEGFSLKAILPPGGLELESRPISSSNGWAISSNSKNIETAVKYFDFWFTEEGRRLMNFGIEGKHYDLADGKAIFKAELLQLPDFKKQLTEAGVQMDVGFRQDFEYEKQWLTQAAVDGMELYESSGCVAAQFPMLSMEFSPDEMSEYSNLSTQISTYVEECRQKWILGASDITETYDDYLTKLEGFGIKKLIELQQNAYNRYMNNQ